MLHLAPYQSGLWLAEYLNVRCQLCRVYRSEPLLKSAPNPPLTAANSSNPDSLLTHSSRADSSRTSHSLSANLRRKINHHFNSGLLC